MAEEIKEGKSKKSLILIVVGSVIGLILVLGILFFFVFSKKEEPAEAQAQMQNAPAPIKGNTGRPAYTSSGPFFAIPEPFIANLVGQNGRRYLKTSVTLDLSSVEFQKEVNAKLPLIQDVIVRILSAKTFEEVATEKGKMDLKNEIRDKINEFMIDGYVKDVLLTGFVVQ